jgi:hypothetical protein
MVSTRYLTKSRFKIALDCPNKLFYTKKGNSYTDKSVDDPFMEALAEGGFQVGELAKFYRPGGADVTSLNETEALANTNAEMAKENAIIYEGAFLWNNCFVRADVVVKRGDKISLYEVKAKSYRGKDSAGMTSKSGLPNSEWKPYVYDVAFQKYIIKNAFPQFSVKAYLTLANKDAICSVDGLNQKFFIDVVDGRKSVRVCGDVSLDALGVRLLADVDVDEMTNLIYDSIQETDIKQLPNGRSMSFAEMVQLFSENYKNDTELITLPTSGCLGCQYRNNENFDKSGFHRCWTREFKLTPTDFEKKSAFDLWGGSLGSRSLKKEFIDKKKFFMKDLEEDDVAPKKIPEVVYGMSAHDRRLHQIEFAKTGSKEAFVSKEDLKIEIDSWTYPLHFIDFETTALAIPMHKGMRPYEGIAFQFSHHTVDKDGKVKHAGEWINTDRGVYPNFQFVRELKAQLENDEGTIFRYHNHENTYLNMIYRQLKESGEPDKELLMSFIQAITKPTGDTVNPWTPGERNMVDLYQLVTSYYIHPMMKGSNSIKKVLPAVLNDSEFLKEKYGQPIYGGEIESKNFSNQVWVKLDENGNAEDPYKLLEPVFKDLSVDQLETLVTSENSGMNDGGAAMMAYARMQFGEMTDFERESYKNALLRYCELDTLAMVMIYEHWKSIVND